MSKTSEISLFAGSIPYHIHTIWLFTRSDLKTIIIPSALFASVCVLSGIENHVNWYHASQLVLRNLPKTMLWIWINLLPLDIDNQRRPASIQEDMENKPWRALPARRLSSEQAKLLMQLGLVAALFVSLRIGGLLQCISIMVLGYWYNHLNGADSGFVVRNFLNSAGYMAFASGALEVMLQKSALASQPQTTRWVLMIGAVILTSIHSQDIQDQAGDRLRCRKTLPLVIGDGIARWTVAAVVFGWSFVCPAFWQLGVKGFLIPTLLGGIVGGRYLSYREVSADKISFLVYNFWIVSLYFLPLAKRLEVPG